MTRPINSKPLHLDEFTAVLSRKPPLEFQFQYSELFPLGIITNSEGLGAEQKRKGGIKGKFGFCTEALGRTEEGKNAHLGNTRGSWGSEGSRACARCKGQSTELRQETTGGPNKISAKRRWCLNIKLPKYQYISSLN